MIGISKKRNIWAVLLALTGVIILSACHSHTVLTINKDDTYSLNINFSQSTALIKGKKCLDIIPLSNKQAAGIQITDKVTKDKIECNITIKNQHISQARKPFVIIKHYADSFQVQLPPLKKLDYLKPNQTDFKFTIIFPGPVLSVNSTLEPQISDNQITWDNPELLAQGFTVLGQDHPGITQTSKWLIFFTVIFALLILIIYLMREHPLVKPKIVATRERITQLRNILMVKFAGPLSALDFASPSRRRARRARRIAKRNAANVNQKVEDQNPEKQE